jgi:cell division septation protein DedD
MRPRRLLLLVLMALGAAPLGAQTATDSALARARQLVTEGNGAAGRALVDSVLQGVKPSSPEFAEALWWRATFAETTAAAERDFLRLSVEFALSARGADALMRLGQLEVARGARETAVKLFDRLVSEHADSPLVTEALFWKGRTLLDGGDLPRGCAAMGAARARTTPRDVEQRNRLEFYGRRCVGVDTSSAASPAPSAGAPAPRDPVREAPRETPPAAEKPAKPAKATTPEKRFAVQVSSASTRGEAEKVASRLEKKGYDVRVLGDAKPFRVWVGRFPTRAAAEAMRKRLKAAGNKAAFVVEGA